MVALRVSAFGGMIPALDDRLLPDNAAVLAENALLESGAIVPLPKPTFVDTLAPGTLRAYRLPASYTDAAFFPLSTYIEFADPDTTVVRGPVFGDTYDRYYWASPSGVPMYNTRARIELGDPPWLLGIPAPAAPPGVTPSGGVSSVTVTRSYVYTYVSAYGEEGPPSVPTVVTGKIDDTWNLTFTSPVAGDLGVNRNLTQIKVYRTITNSLGVATHYLVTTLTLPTVAFADTLTDPVVVLNSVLESTNWTAPPADLQGFVLMANGIFAGWRTAPVSEIWFSEPYRPHAWPGGYVQTVEYPIVGMGVLNNTLVVCTAGHPTTVTGAHPQYMAPSKINELEPCVSRGSILSTTEGVYYASPNGLVLVVPGQAVNITKDIISKRKWQSLTEITKLRAARLGMAYMAYGSAQVGVFQTDTFQNDAFMMEDVTGARAGVVIDPTSQRVAFSMLRSDDPLLNCYNDVWSGEVMLISDDLYALDLVNPMAEPQPCVWLSKIFQTTEIKNFAAVKIFWDLGITTWPIPPAELGQFQFYVDERLVYTRPLVKSGELFKLPSGFKGDFCQFKLTSKVRIMSIQIATTAKELASA